jgi:hypothetical protein
VSRWRWGVAGPGIMPDMGIAARFADLFGAPQEPPVPIGWRVVESRALPPAQTDHGAVPSQASSIYVRAPSVRRDGRAATESGYSHRTRPWTDSRGLQAGRRADHRNRPCQPRPQPTLPTFADVKTRNEIHLDPARPGRPPADACHLRAGPYPASRRLNAPSALSCREECVGHGRF